MKRLYILAGANGSGKSTFSRVLLPTEGIVYVNPDDIAKTLNPANPAAVQIEAGKETLRKIDELMGEGESFAIESTLSGTRALRCIFGGRMPEIVEKMTRIGNTAVHAAQEENRRKGIPNVYVLNGKIVWQLPDGSITTTRPA